MSSRDCRITTKSPAGRLGLGTTGKRSLTAFLNQSKALPLSSIFGSPAAHRVLCTCGRQSTLQRRRCGCWRRAYPSPISISATARGATRCGTVHKAKRVSVQRGERIRRRRQEGRPLSMSWEGSFRTDRSLNNRPRDCELVRLMTGRTLRPTAAFDQNLVHSHFPSEFRQQSDLLWL